MEIAGRSNKPWDALFIFHFLASEGDQMVADKLRKMIARESDKTLNFERQITAGKRGAPCQISGRFFKREECIALVSMWNEPDGDMAFRCYTPNHGIATVTDGRLDWWALICFQCANAGIFGPLALAESSAPNRLLPVTGALEEKLIGLLPERPFPVRM